MRNILAVVGQLGASSRGRTGAGAVAAGAAAVVYIRGAAAAAGLPKFWARFATDEGAQMNASQGSAMCCVVLHGSSAGCCCCCRIDRLLRRSDFLLFGGGWSAIEIRAAFADVCTVAVDASGFQVTVDGHFSSLCFS